MPREEVEFSSAKKPWRTIRSRRLVEVGEVKLFEDSLISQAGLRNKHLRLMLNDFSVIVPVLDDGRLIFEWNYRHALNGWELELPAGLVENGEDALKCAKRELSEETGYSAKSWKKIGWVHTLPGITGQRAHLFLAKNLDAGKAHPEPVEIMSVETLPVKRAYQLLHHGRIVHAPTVVAMSFAEDVLLNPRHGR